MSETHGMMDESIGGEAYEAWRLIPPQNLWPGSTLWSVPAHTFCHKMLLDPKLLHYMLSVGLKTPKKSILAGAWP